MTIVLPGQAGEEKQATNTMNAFLVQTRISIATAVLAQLVPMQIMQTTTAKVMEKQKRKQEQDPFGVKDDAEDISIGPEKVPIDLGMPIHLSIAAAEGLMARLGLIADTLPETEAEAEPVTEVVKRATRGK